MIDGAIWWIFYIKFLNAFDDQPRRWKYVSASFFVLNVYNLATVHDRDSGIVVVISKYYYSYILYRLYINGSCVSIKITVQDPGKRS